MAQRALLVTGRGDVHADLVEAHIRDNGGNPFRMNLDEFPEEFEVELAFGDGYGGGRVGCLATGDTLELAEIGAVWMRGKASFSFRSKDLGPQERAFATEETEHLLLGLLYSLDCYWMSHPAALRRAGWKGEQLDRAARMGFAVPPSIFTNDRRAAEAFLARHGEVVFKSLSTPMLAAEMVGADDRVVTGLPTTRITAEHREMLDAVAELPCFFQRYVPKRHELRVTVVGDRLFAARIHSQDDPRTAVDCRDMSAEIRYEKTVLPVEIERRCLEFVHSYGLTYGAIDLIVTPDGDHVFLENNPVGQFLFVQELVPELDMIGAVADCLMEGARSCDRAAA